MADFTPTQGRYLAFIQAYADLHGCPPAESEIAAALCVSPPSVNQMVKALEKRGLIQRQPGRPRSLRVIVPEDGIPPWHHHMQSRRSAQGGDSPRQPTVPPPAPPANLYVFSVYLTAGPISEKFANKPILRVIEVRGDQTLAQFHRAIFDAYDRWREHPYQFQLGKRPFDADGPNYGDPDLRPRKRRAGNARTTTLDALELKPYRTFGYWFDFRENWFHQVQLERVERAIATVVYPRVIRRVGKSPPQYDQK